MKLEKLNSGNMIVFTLVFINFNTGHYKIEVHYCVNDTLKQIDSHGC